MLFGAITLSLCVPTMEPLACEMFTVEAEEVGKWLLQERGGEHKFFFLFFFSS